MHVDTNEELVTYLGRSIPRRGFRAYIYASDGRTKIAESYDEFYAHIHRDQWFATQEEALKPVAIIEQEEFPKKTRGKKTEA